MKTNLSFWTKVSIYLFIVNFLTISAGNAQNSGLGFNYQAVIRDLNGFLIQDKQVVVRFSLYPEQHANNPTWVEKHTVNTDSFGAFSSTIGKGERTDGVVANFTDINFSGTYYWLKIEVEQNNSFKEISFTQLPSTPYAEAVTSSPFPAGIIVPFGGDADHVPAGWILCDGRELRRSEYMALYRVIQTSFGEGDGSSTFNAPDLRGVFLRGVSGTSEKDKDADSRSFSMKGSNKGNAVGTYQGDAIRNFTGTIIAQGDGVFKDAGGYFFLGGKNAYTNRTSIFDPSLKVPVGSDNRPVNISVNYIIKW